MKMCVLCNNKPQAARSLCKACWMSEYRKGTLRRHGRARWANDSAKQPEPPKPRIVEEPIRYRGEIRAGDVVDGGFVWAHEGQAFEVRSYTYCDRPDVLPKTKIVSENELRASKRYKPNEAGTLFAEAMQSKTAQD